MNGSPLGSSVHGILQARILKWVVISSLRGSLPSKDQTPASCVFCIGRWILSHCATWEAPRCIHIAKVFWEVTSNNLLLFLKISKTCQEEFALHLLVWSDRVLWMGWGDLTLPQCWTFQSYLLTDLHAHPPSSASVSTCPLALSTAGIWKLSFTCQLGKVICCYCSHVWPKKKNSI